MELVLVWILSYCRDFIGFLDMQVLSKLANSKKIADFGPVLGGLDVHSSPTISNCRRC